MAEHSEHSLRRATLGLFIPALIFLALAGYMVNRLIGGKKSRLTAEADERAAEVNAGPRVQVVTVGASVPEHDITLLGEVHPFISATLYAKVSGYLKDLRVDKGDRVTANQVIAVIESPELDHQYQSAVADAANKRLNAQRAETLVKRQMISQQDADQASTDAKMADSNVAQLATLKSYEILRAPFEGVITARFADPGALIQNATNSETSALPVVTVSEIDRLRIYVYVPQADASFVRDGDPAVITLPERPGVKIHARVTRTTDQLDLKTRTLLAEIDSSNEDRLILPGSFVGVTLQIRAPSYLQVPSEALVVRGQKAFVAVVGGDNRVTYKPVTIADDDGQRVRLLSGVERGQRVALSLGESVAEGSLVQPVEVQ